MTDPWTLTARWIIPADAPPLERGIVTISGDHIVAIESHGTCTADMDLGNVAILPGFVNAHTHLDLSGLRGKCPPGPHFTEWLRSVIHFRRNQTPEELQEDIHAGLGESVANGTTMLGDIAAFGASWEMLATAPLRAVVFHELLGLSRERAFESVKKTAQWWVRHPDAATCRSGLSPHAPYTFRASYLPDLAGPGKRIAIHLAESTAELELLDRQSGPFVPFLAERDAWAPDGLASSVEQVIELTKAATPVLYIHANYLRPTASIPPNASIIYCPRTHAAFGHPPHPFREFMARGVRLALGTDSLASNPDLSVLAEARFVHERYPDVPGQTVLRMATLSGAEALGWADETGSLTPGKSADLVVLPLPDDDSPDPYRLVLVSDLTPARVLFRGQWTVGAP